MHNEIRVNTYCGLGHSECQEIARLRGQATERPGWVDPVAVVIAVVGVGGGAVLIARSRRLI